MKASPKEGQRDWRSGHHALVIRDFPRPESDPVRLSFVPCELFHRVQYGNELCSFVCVCFPSLTMRGNVVWLVTIPPPDDSSESSPSLLGGLGKQGAILCSVNAVGYYSQQHVNIPIVKHVFAFPPKL